MLTRRFTLMFLMLALIVLGVAPRASAQYVTADRYVGAGYVLVTVSTNLIKKPTRANSADHVFYNPSTGAIVVGLTNHPQKSGYNGSIQAPGDCYASFNSFLTGATIQVADLDGDGLTNDILLYRPADGRIKQFRVTLAGLFPGCDTSDSW